MSSNETGSIKNYRSKVKLKKMKREGKKKKEGRKEREGGRESM